MIIPFNYDLKKIILMGKMKKNNRLEVEMKK